MAVDVVAGSRGSTLRAVGCGLDLKLEGSPPGSVQRFQRARRRLGCGEDGDCPRGDRRRHRGACIGPRPVSSRSTRGRGSWWLSTTLTPPTLSRTSCGPPAGLTDGRVLAVFGCGGDRDRSETPGDGGGGGAAGRRGLRHVRQPAERGPGGDPEGDRAGDGGRRGYRVIVDREQAIAEALANAAQGDVVVIAGKGHETGQTVGGTVLPFDDRLVAARILKGMPR